jgi:hypothetical protein
MNVDDIFYNTLVMHLSGGLLAGQSNDRDLRFHDTPEKKKEEILAETAIKYAKEIIKQLSGEIR